VPGFRYNARVTLRSMAALLLLLVLVAFPALATWPHQIAMIRLAGLSILWWYGGIVAPVLAGLIAIAWLPDREPPPRAE
jgi:hypothetical protein